MVPIRRFGIVDFMLFVYILVIAGGVRAGYLALAADNGRNAGPLVVQDPAANADLAALSQSVKDNNAFVSPAPLSDAPEETAHVSPGYPWLLGMASRYIPTDRFDSAIRWIQCGLGTLTAGLYYLFARRAFRSVTVGVLAGMLCAVHPFWVVNTAAIDDGVLASFLVSLVLFTGARAGQTGGPLTSLVYGLGLAAMALVRAALLPFAFVGLGCFLLHSRRVSGGWLGALLAFLGFIIGVAPWAARNWQVYAEPTPIVDSTYLHLLMGNNPKADGGPGAAADVLTPEKVQGLKEVKKQPNRYARLGPVVLDEVKRDPAAVPQHRLQAGLAFLFGAPPHPPVQDATTSEAERPTAKVPVVAAADATPGASNALASYQVVFLWTVLGLVVLGLLGWRWSYGWRAESKPAALAMIWIPLPYILSHAEVLSGPRLPLDGVLLCYAAFALLCFLPGLRRHLLEGAKAEALPPR